MHTRLAIWTQTLADLHQRVHRDREIFDPIIVVVVNQRISGKQDVLVQKMLVVAAGDARVQRLHGCTANSGTCLISDHVSHKHDASEQIVPTERHTLAEEVKEHWVLATFRSFVMVACRNRRWVRRKEEEKRIRTNSVRRLTVFCGLNLLLLLTIDDKKETQVRLPRPSTKGQQWQKSCTLLVRWLHVFLGGHDVSTRVCVFKKP